MGRPPLPRAQVLGHVVTLRFRNRLLEMIRRAARQEKLPVAELIRRILEENLDRRFAA